MPYNIPEKYGSFENENKHLRCVLVVKFIILHSPSRSKLTTFFRHVANRIANRYKCNSLALGSESSAVTTSSHTVRFALFCPFILLLTFGSPFHLRHPFKFPYIITPTLTRAPAPTVLSFSQSQSVDRVNNKLLAYRTLKQVLRFSYNSWRM